MAIGTEKGKTVAPRRYNPTRKQGGVFESSLSAEVLGNGFPLATHGISIRLEAESPVIARLAFLDVDLGDGFLFGCDPPNSREKPRFPTRNRPRKKRKHSGSTQDCLKKWPQGLCVNRYFSCTTDFRPLPSIRSSRSALFPSSIPQITDVVTHCKEMRPDWFPKSLPANDLRR